MKAFARCGWGMLVVLALIAAGAAGKTPGGAACPLKPGSPSGGDVQWAFTKSGAPQGAHHGIKSSYTHGRGSWTKGRAIGRACSQDTLTKGSPRDLVLSVSGKAKLSPKVTELGHLGVRLIIGVRVSASDDPACTTGSRGTVTMFASYYSVHRDSLKLHFAAGCTGHNLSYGGSTLHVYIARHGAQVNAA